jgi:hypothetical protein
MATFSRSTTTLLVGLLLAIPLISAADSDVPEPFQRFSADSRYSISYAELNEVLKKVVVNTGRSDREKAEPVHASTGTRMKPNVKRSTVNEANRFYYEVFAEDEVAAQYLLDVQKNLEGIPAEAPLEYFSRNEQLAYWLNLYNVTLINEIIKVYPKRKLKKLLTGGHSILQEKLLNVAGVPLSLNDIQYTILKQNYNNDPLILYGLYQGVIGGPNIRKGAYTAANVWSHLEENAAEFVNSNRGTQAKDERTFRASSLYDRNRAYFPNFQADLKKHLLDYLESPEKGELQGATTIKPDIDDWTVTDLYGSYPELGGSMASNRAALLDSIRSTSCCNQSGAGGSVAFSSNHSNASGKLTEKSTPASFVSPELITYLHEIKLKEERYNEEHGIVTVEELGEVPANPDAAPAEDSNQRE